MPPASLDLASVAAVEAARAGFSPEFSQEARAQVEGLRAESQPQRAEDTPTVLPWSSIDNDSSRDLDQIELAEELPDGRIHVRVAIANVAESIGKGTPIDQHAEAQTVTLYTPARTFPMLPLELSTDLTSLNEGELRDAIIIEFTVAPDGDLSEVGVSSAVVKNQAQLTYSAVGLWLDGKTGADQPGTGRIAGSAELQKQLRLQDQAAQTLRSARMRRGALDFERPEVEPVVSAGAVTLAAAPQTSRATQLIEELMIAANEVMARTLTESGRSSLRRIVRSPERWSRLVQLAAEAGTTLPTLPDSEALSAFLRARRVADPLRYPDLSLAVIKLMGAGEYVLDHPGQGQTEGHFGLATQDYTHGTAPNRRFADLVLQRTLLSLLRGEPPPYTDAELASIAAHCNEREAAARKLERAMRKRATALSLADSIGRIYRGVITGASPKGTYIRIISPPVEGRVTQGEGGLDVGDIVSVRLLRADAQLGFIDFGRA